MSFEQKELTNASLSFLMLGEKNEQNTGGRDQSAKQSKPEVQ
jgi:hypothetical protein